MLCCQFSDVLVGGVLSFPVEDNRVAEVPLGAVLDVDPPPPQVVLSF